VLWRYIYVFHGNYFHQRFFQRIMLGGAGKGSHDFSLLAPASSILSDGFKASSTPLLADKLPQDEPSLD
jgi:hypothetical protein